MKTTKIMLAVALIAAVVAPSFQSCKKGEGDPFLSLKSRKARVAGEWSFTSLKDESSYSNTSSGGGQSSTYSGNDVFEVTGSTVRVTSTSTDGQNTTSASGSGNAVTTVVFEKDGTFSIKYVFSNINLVSDGQTIVQNMTTESSGTWNFLGGVEEDYKKKERMILNVTKETTSVSYVLAGSVSYSETENTTQTYANGEYAQIWHLTTLKNKEMVVEAERNGVGSYTSSYDYAGTTGSSTGSSTTKGKLSGTLEQ